MALTQVGTDGVKDDAITLAKQAAGTDGQIITYDASGNPVAVGPGTDGQVLTSTGAGSPPAFEAIPTPVDATKTTLTGSTNNTITTVTGANAIQGESGLTFDGSTMNFTAASGDARLTLIGTEGNDARISLVADDGDDHIDQYNIRSNADDNSLSIDQFESGSFVERVTVANGGNVGINQSSPGDLLEINPASNNDGLTIKSTGVVYPALTFDVNRTGADQFLGNIRGEWNGTTVANIIFETGDDTTNKDNGVITFRTASAGSPAERLRIQSGGGISFNGDTAAANALNDYEEGYWSPTAVDGMTLHLQNSNNVAARRYVKIGRQVTCWFDINWDSGNSSANFRTRFGGLPFSKEATSEGAAAPLVVSYFDGSETVMNAHSDGSNLLSFYKNGNDMWSYSNSAGDRIAGCFTYFTDS